ncbi:SHOCT domain-containing protein [Streptomyces sp. NPDC057428]|uniref:SHOCT domain-containing protein n=1 Tax=Streptomyces sp. NPDC057428 TaxID=3346129 RepID=UPI0036A96AC1
MPGLVRGVARTAVVAGTATAVSNRVSRRQQGRWAAQETPAQSTQPAPPQGSSPPTHVEDAASSKIAQLKDLGELRESGVLTEAEFEEQKRKILAT